MNIFDQVVLLATGLVALYLIWRFFSHYQSSKELYDVSYIVAFAVLLVAGLSLIFLGYDVLQSPLVVIVAVLIPAGLSLGLVAEFSPEYAKAYLVFAVIGLIAIALTRFTGPSALATIVLVIVYTVAGLLIVVLPIWAVMQKKAPAGFIGAAIGGVLIGVGGIALAFLKLGTQLLFFSQAVVLTILAPLLLLMALAFAWGFVKKIKA